MIQGSPNKALWLKVSGSGDSEGGELVAGIYCRSFKQFCHFVLHLDNIV